MAEFRTHKAVNSRTREVLDSSSLKIECKLGEILEQQGITQTELELLTGVRQASINDMIYDRKKTINKEHLLAVMIALNITDITKIYKVSFDDSEEYEEKLEKEEYFFKNGLSPEQEDLLAKLKKEKQDKKKKG